MELIAKTFIEEIQKTTYINNNIDLNSVKKFIKDRNEFINNDELLLDKFRKTNNNPYLVLSNFKRMKAQFLNEFVSCYQDPYEYIGLRNIEEGIRETAFSLGYDLPTNPIISSISTAEINARIFELPGLEKQIILFKSGILKFYSELTRTIMTLVKWERQPNGMYLMNLNQEEAIKTVENNSFIFDKIYLTIERILTGKSALFSDSKNEFFMPFMFPFFAPLRSATWSFIVSHEYGHILNGDLNNDNKNNLKYKLKNGQEISLSEFQEHQADLKGFELTNNYLTNDREVDFFYSISGACIFFSGIDLINRIIGDVFDMEYEFKSSHPNPINRWKFLTTYVFKNAVNKDAVLENITLSSKFSDLVEIIYANNGQLIKDLKNKKERIRKIWHA